MYDNYPTAARPDVLVTERLRGQVERLFDRATVDTWTLPRGATESEIAVQYVKHVADLAKAVDWIVDDLADRIARELEYLEKGRVRPERGAAVVQLHVDSGRS